MGIIDRIFKDKKNTNIIYILLAVGILLLVGGKTSVHTPNEEIKTQVRETSLEARMEKVLSEIDGVGEAVVMICPDTTKEKEKGLVIGEEKESDASERSVVVVADGGGNSVVREKIMRAVQNALGAPPHKIEVFERKENQ